MHAMTALLTDGPAAEPITLAEARTFLRLDQDAEDGLVGALVTAARLHVEASTRRLLMTQRWRLVHDRWPGAFLPIPLSPLREVEAIRLFAADGTAATLPPADWWVDPAPGTGRLFSTRTCFPNPGRRFAGIEVDVVAGYGTAADVPEPLRQAIRLLVAHWFEQRLLVGEAGSPLPRTVDALLAPYRVLM